jgi:hypothetical protein
MCTPSSIDVVVTGQSGLPLLDEALLLLLLVGPLLAVLALLVPPPPLPVVPAVTLPPQATAASERMAKQAGPEERKEGITAAGCPGRGAVATGESAGAVDRASLLSA